MRCLSFTRAAFTSMCYTTWKLQECGHTFIRRLSTKSQNVCPILSVAPLRALADEKFKVLVENLPPASPVTIQSLHQSEDQDYWEAYGHYISDHRGIVSVCALFQAAAKGSGKAVCPMLVNISVYGGHEGFREKPPLASVLTERWHMAPGIQRTNLTVKGMQGTLLIPPGPGPFPGILDVWGGGGGLVDYRAALLASHGYAALALENVTLGDTQRADQDFSYFEMAFDILKNHPQVIPNRVGVLGLCLGSNVLLHLTAKSPTLKPHCCVCISASNIWPSDGTLNGVLRLLFGKFNKLRLDENNYQVWRDVGLEILRDPTNTVDVGKINCPLLLISGTDDQNWPTSEYTEHMAQMMRSAGKEHLLTTVMYPDAGHLIEPPFSPHFRATAFKMKSPDEKVILLWGGQTKPHSDAQEDSWRKILSFLKQHLYCSP